MADYSDEAVAKRQEQIAKLREEVQEAKSGGNVDLTAESNKITLAALDAEEQRLQAELAQHKAVTSRKAVNAATKDSIEQVQETAPEEPPASRRGRTQEKE